MKRQTIDERLLEINRQAYPLIISESDGEMMALCLTRIMEYVPEDDHVFVRADYSGLSSALCHPVGEDGIGGTNERVRDD